MEPNAQPGGTRQRRHFGRRKGPALSAYQSGLLETLLPQLRMDPEPGRDPRAYFSPGLSEVWLEVGFGGGEHLLWQAQANPRIGIIGAEPYVSGVAKLLSKLAADERVSNIRLYTEDAGDIIAALPDACLGRVFVLFPDPWPKTRHHKRRFVQRESLDRLAELMIPGAELRLATDDPSYLPWMVEQACIHPGFDWLAEGPADWRQRPADWPQTRYEKKMLAGKPTFLRLRRR